MGMAAYKIIDFFRNYPPMVKIFQNILPMRYFRGF